MADRRAPRVPLRRLTRRQLLGAAGGGALLGSAWAAAFRRALADDEPPTVTVARTTSALAVLIAAYGHRVAVIDAADGDGAAESTELAAGFLRQRIDTVLAPTALAATLSRSYRARWRVRDVWSLPDAPDPSGRGLAGRALEIGGLRITADALPLGAWRVAPPDTRSWYVAVTFGVSCNYVVSDGPAVDRLPIDGTRADVVICGDIEMPAPRLVSAIGALAVPSEAIDAMPAGPALVPLVTSSPVVFRLRASAVELPEPV
jgi:hypothetical protein